MSTLTIQICDASTIQFIEKEAAQAGFADPSGYIQALLKEKQLAKRKAEIEARLHEALDEYERGECTEMTAEDWQRLRSEFRQRHGIKDAS